MPLCVSLSSLRLLITTRAISTAATMSKTKVFFEISAGGNALGRVVIEVSESKIFKAEKINYQHNFMIFVLQLRGDVVPKTAGECKCVCVFTCCISFSVRFSCREFPCSLYGRERIRLQRIFFPSCHSWLHVPGWRLYQGKWNWWKVHLRRKVSYKSCVRCTRCFQQFFV